MLNKNISNNLSHSRSHDFRRMYFCAEKLAAADPRPINDENLN